MLLEIIHCLKVNDVLMEAGNLQQQCMVQKIKKHGQSFRLVRSKNVR